MTLTPSVRAISLCSFPRVANSFACASFVAISNLECFLLAMTTQAPTAQKVPKWETIAAQQINMMGRSVRCKRLLRYFASRNGDVTSTHGGGVRRTHEQGSSIKQGKDSSIKQGKGCARRAAYT